MGSPEYKKTYLNGGLNFEPPIIPFEEKVGRERRTMRRKVAKAKAKDKTKAPAEEDNHIVEKHDLQDKAPAEKNNPIVEKRNLQNKTKAPAEEDNPVNEKHNLRNKSKAPAEEDNPVIEKHNLQNKTKAPAEEDNHIVEKHDLQDKAPAEEDNPVNEKHNLQAEKKNSQKDFVRDKPLNVVIFFPDDLNHRALQDVSGSDYVKTPFLTSLAKDGIRFAKNAVTTSICWISRASLFTGQFASSHGSLELKCPRFTLPQYWKDSWVATLQSVGGYYVGHVGKWQYHNQQQGHSLRFNYTKIFEGHHWYPQFHSNDISASDKSVKATLEFLEKRPKDRPFALTVAFYPPKAVGNSFEPGGQWSPKNSTKDLYANTVYKRPYDIEKAHANLPDFLREKMVRNRYLERWNSTEQYNVGMRYYHALVTEVDIACSQIVDELKRQDLYDNTMIIFTSDNGLLMGSHGIGGKWIAYEESIRVPLIIYDPRIPLDKRGSVNNAMTLNVDLATTILGAANITPPKVMEGRDIADLYLPPDKATTKLEEKPWRTEFMYEFPLWSMSSNALIGERYKYIEWPGHNYEQLFDLQNDPFELNDLLKLMKKNETEGTSDDNTQLEKLAVGLVETLHGLKVSPSDLRDIMEQKGTFGSLLGGNGEGESGSKKSSLKELVQGLLVELKNHYEDNLEKIKGSSNKPDWCNASLPYQ